MEASRFRIATEADVDAVLALMADYYAEDGYPFVAARAQRTLLELLGDARNGRLWVAEAGGGIAGYLAVTLGFSLEHGGRDAFLDELYIVESRRGAGLGREAVETAIAWCREAGARALHLEVERARERARALYRRTGFVDNARCLMTRRLD